MQAAITIITRLFSSECCATLNNSSESKMVLQAPNIQPKSLCDAAPVQTYRNSPFRDPWTKLDREVLNIGVSSTLKYGSC